MSKIRFTSQTLHRNPSPHPQSSNPASKPLYCNFNSFSTKSHTNFLHSGCLVCGMGVHSQIRFKNFAPTIPSFSSGFRFSSASAGELAPLIIHRLPCCAVMPTQGRNFCRSHSPKLSGFGLQIFVMTYPGWTP
jgi:hypothetical protein